jgi:hypothetical protein
MVDNKNAGSRSLLQHASTPAVTEYRINLQISPDDKPTSAHVYMVSIYCILSHIILQVYLSLVYTGRTHRTIPVTIQYTNEQVLLLYSIIIISWQHRTSSEQNYYHQPPFRLNTAR